MLHQLADGLWENKQPLRFIGTEVGCRMTCLRLSSGDIVVHSPVRASDDLAEAVSQQGTIRWLVAPNALHHLFITDWQERFPSAEVLIAPKLRKKRPDLATASLLTTPPAEWAGELEVEPVGGIPWVDEFVFFHRATSTLIVTDLAFNFGQESPFLTRCFIRMTGRLGQLAPTRIERLMVRDRAALRSSLDRILQWPFERVVVSHGEILESGGRDALAAGFDWLK